MDRSDIRPEHTRSPDPLRQREARAYGRARRRLGAAGTALSTAALLAIALATRTLGGPLAVVLLLVGVPLLTLPLGYAGYRLSRRVGLSRQTAGGWLADRAKGSAVGAVLAVLAGGALLGFQRLAPDWWPLFAWAGALALSTLLAALWPLLLLPLFLRSERLAEGPLAEELWRTTRAAGLTVRELRLLRMGEKTAAANAMVAGLGPTVRVYVSDTLAERHDESEEEALARSRVVLAHELGHYVHRDVLRLVALSAVSLAGTVAGGWLAQNLLAPHRPGHLSSLPSFVLGASIAGALLGPLSAWYARRRERAADAYAVTLTGDGEAFARAMERLVAQNLAELDPPRLHHLLTATHPTPRERIVAARAR